MPSKQDILLLLSLMKGKSTYIQKIIRKEDRSKMSSSTSRFLFDKDVPARIGDNSKRLVLFLANVAEYIRYICMQFRYERRIYVSSFSFVGKYCQASLTIHKRQNSVNSHSTQIQLIAFSNNSEIVLIFTLDRSFQFHNGGTLNRAATSYNDIFDVFKLASKFYNFEDSGEIE